ncbi:helix-turn-helix domain-containing protein [Planomonospora sp. ID82291]|uniref:helix-turn-helix domain-containing protein n=1 Tax=Planomonospora sp. ID82291 TaxID=2738136 RepID=UPI0018C38A3A|nr:helix-turn-helix domain-containing protein [Planomonospora sp. ID82291]MBG0818994.1 hypothetical protein [Planomonospora sp. ID82291]
MNPDTTPGRRAVDVAAATRLYLEDGLSVRQIGQRLGWSHTTIHEALVGAGVPLRARGRGGRRIPDQTRQEIVAAYVAGESLRSLLARHQVAAQTIRNIVTEAGVPLRKGGCVRAGKARFDRQAAARLAEDGWTAPAIAILMGFSEGHVRRVLRGLGYGRAPLPAGEDLALAYDRAGSIRGLAVELGCSPWRVKRALEREGIRALPRPRALVAMVRASGSGRAVAEELGCSVGRLRAALERGGVRTRSKVA